MLISRAHGPDVRVEKEAHTLALAGYQMHVIAWDREGRHPVHTIEHTPGSLSAALADWSNQPATAPTSVVVTHIQVQAGYQTGRRLLRTLPVFWWRAFQELRRFQPDIVHAHDLDTLPVGMAYGRLARCPVIYDAREYYPGMVRDNVGSWLTRGLERLDRWLTPRTDAVVTVGERLAARFRLMGGSVWVVHNSQPLPDHAKLDQRARVLREEWGIPEGALVVVYVGWLNPDRLLLPLVDAVRQIPDVWLIIGGDGPQKVDLQRAAQNCERIRLLSWVPLHEVPEVVAAGDVVYYGLNARNPNSQYFMPNLGFYALGVGRPLLVTPVGEIAAVVQRERCGLVLVDATPEAALKALRQLRNTPVRLALARQAQRLGRSRFHWGRAADTLLQLYTCLSGVKNCHNSEEFRTNFTDENRYS
ncbi:MAG: glycosyltransferase family 4 protein [Chloroflexi bacterium]|nr:glycosyltransferase family 4 protein [Chloroflexota bacterium]